jgi:hypothetical protein
MFIPDPGSGFFNLGFRIQDPGVNKAQDPGSGSATLVSSTTRPRTLNPAFWAAIGL